MPSAADHAKELRGHLEDLHEALQDLFNAPVFGGEEPAARAGRAHTNALSALFDLEVALEMREPELTEEERILKAMDEKFERDLAEMRRRAAEPAFLAKVMRQAKLRGGGNDGR